MMFFAGSGRALLSVVLCTESCFNICYGHGKTPCKAWCGCYVLVNVDRAASFLSVVDVGGFHE
jgi:hypothetical protein